MTKQGFYGRAVVLYAAVSLLLLALLGRIVSLNVGGVYSASNHNRERVLYENTLRGSIYDRNGMPLVNTETRSLCAVKPTYSLLLSGGDRLTGVFAPLQKGLPVLTDTDAVSVFGAENVLVLPCVTRYAKQQTAAHLIGYTDSTGEKGLCGLEAAYDALLKKYTGTLRVTYESDPDGRALAGEPLRVSDTTDRSRGGILLTLDRTLQSFAETLLADSGITQGACVVLDAADCAILASVSCPTYSFEALADSLDDPLEPFLNRCLCAWQVGSVFKPIVAAAALENGLDATAVYTCTGSQTAGNSVFHCFNKTAHGAVTLDTALASSCNCYFIQVGLQLGAQALHATADAFRFGKPVTPSDGFVSDAGYLPPVAALDSPSAVANLCFGQGSLLATPLQIAAAYAVLANDGIYRAPYLVKAMADAKGAVFAYYLNETDERIVSTQTALSLANKLCHALQEGVAAAGKPTLGTAAGKTATAQTGQYGEDGAEKLVTWFAGFLPYENPQYVAVILKENGSAASLDCAPVFQKLADYLYANGFIS